LGGVLGQIDDFQAPVTEGHGATGEKPGAVGAAGGDGIGHPGDAFDIGISAVEAHLSGDSAHYAGLSFLATCRGSHENKKARTMPRQLPYS
jgi:hypothetical protein